MNKDHLTPGSRECQCGACGEYFSSPAAFDQHRVRLGEFGNACANRKGMKMMGMAQDDQGRWQTREAATTRDARQGG